MGDKLNASREEPALPRFAGEIEKALFDSEILRNHLTVEIKTPDSWVQEYRVTYRNKRKDSGNIDNKLNCLRLAPRLKKVQRNLSVYDRMRNRLTIVPSDLVHEALGQICTFYLSKARDLTGDTHKESFDKLIEEIDFSDVFSYRSNPEVVEEILNRIKNFAHNLESVSLKSPEELKKALFYINRVNQLIRIYKYFYIPIVKLEESLKPRDCVLISYFIENLVEKPQQMRNLSLYLWGYLGISFPLELEPKASNHIRILSPPGMMFREAGIPHLEESTFINTYSNLDAFLDDDMVYFHVPKREASEIMRQQRKKLEEEEDQININVSIGVSSNFPWSPSLIRTLTFLMYVAVFLPLITISLP